MKTEMLRSNVTIARVQCVPIPLAKHVKAAAIPSVATMIVPEVRFQFRISASQHQGRPCSHGNVMDVILCIEYPVKYAAISNREIFR